MALPTVDTHQLQSDAWALRDHPDLDVRTLALGANEAAHDVQTLTAALEAARKEIAQLRQRAATAELALINQTKRAASDYGSDDVEDEDFFGRCAVESFRAAGAL